MAVILGVLLVLRDVIKDYVTRFLKWLAEVLYRQLSGHKLFWEIACCDVIGKHWSEITRN